MKYKRAPDVWNRADLYEVVAFAEHLGTSRAAIFDFGAAKRPTVEIGEISVSHIGWDVTADDPSDASHEFVKSVQNWLSTAR